MKDLSAKCRVAWPDVSVLTPTIPGREPFLLEARRSVASQTMRQFEHLVHLDDEHEGCAKTVNRLAERARAPWLFILADDDILLPRCLELLLGDADGAQVVYSPPIVWGEPGAQFCGQPPNIPSAALISSAAWRDVRGYDDRLHHTEDQDLWRRMMEAGARFRRHDEHPTWVYRFWGGNKSRTQGAA